MREVQPGEILTYYGHVNKGFEYPWLKFVVLSESDIFGAEKRKKKKKKLYQGQKINDFNDLKIGDYVVHETHGLGIYKGIEKVEVDKVVKDYLKIEYRDGGNLYILATGLDVIQKYASADAAKKPKLNKLGGKEWEHTKTKVRSAVSAVAKDLVELYAVRQQSEGYAFGKDTVWQREFEEMFPFEETEDQLEAIEATKKDMESRRIMDRLICGDVGYGKTEIALRAAFKAIQEGKQVVYLVPTTILAQQHYNTFVQRMMNFPVRIELLSRFRTAAEQKKTIEDLKNEGRWFFWSAMDGEVMYRCNRTGPIVLVIGNEREGVGLLVREKCDFTEYIPMKGDIDSLNACVAAGVMAFEIVRQRMNVQK